MPKVWPRNGRCVWCKKADSPPSTEDVFAKWIIREFGAQKTTIHRTDKATGITRKTRGKAGILIPTPCMRCNNEWMSRLENKVKPLLAEMMRGSPVRLDDSDQLTISKWMLKTAILHEQAKAVAQGRRTYFNAIDRTKLYEHGIFPTYTRIFAALYAGDVTRTRWHIHADASTILTTHENQRRTFNGQAKCITFTIHHLTLQLFTIRDSPDLEGTSVKFRLSGKWNDDVQISIYPISGSVNWPPKFALDDDGLVAFMGRWDTTQKP